MLFQWFFNLFGKNKINSRHLPVGAGKNGLGSQDPDDARTIIASTNVKIFMRLDDSIELVQGNESAEKMKSPAL
jgi:hypothetical protein